jgi:hypothetical protein
LISRLSEHVILGHETESLDWNITFCLPSPTESNFHTVCFAGGPHFSTSDGLLDAVISLNTIPRRYKWANVDGGIPCIAKLRYRELRFSSVSNLLGLVQVRREPHRKRCSDWYRPRVRYPASLNVALSKERDQAIRDLGEFVRRNSA